MPFKICVLLLTFGVFNARGAAFDPKVFPTRDEVLQEFENNFQSGDVKAFFEARDKDASLNQCRVWLKAATEAYEKAQAQGDIDEMDNIWAGNGEDSQLARPSMFNGRQVLSAVGNRAASFFGSKRLDLPDGTVIAGDVKEKRAVSEKSGLVDLLATCGPCVAMVRVEKKTVYESAGWCKVPGQPKDSFGKASELLTKWKNYPRSKVDGKPDGFNTIVGFGTVDDPTPKVEEIKQGDRAVIVIRTLGNGAYGYFGDIYYKAQTDAKGVKSFSLQFSLPEDKKNADLPGAYQFLKDPITGLEYEVDPLRTDVVGKWFVDSDGILRYYTKADFGVPPYDFMRRIAFSVMIDAIFHMYQKVR